METNTREQTETTVNLPADRLANLLEGKQSESKPQCRNSDIETAKAHPFAKYLPNMDASKFPKIHPHANIFPMMEEDEIQTLVDSIKANGQRNLIRLDHKGRIVDGRNRWVACQRAGVKPLTQQLQRQGNANTLTDIIIENLERRHLTTVQRAVVAELIATAKRGGKNDGNLSLKEAADKVKIDRSTVAAVRQIKEKAPDVYAELAAGKHKSVNEAAEKSGVKKKKAALKYKYILRWVETQNWDIFRIAETDSLLQDYPYVYDSEARAQSVLRELRKSGESVPEPTNGVQRYYTLEIEEGKSWSLAVGDAEDLSGDTFGEYYKSLEEVEAACDALNKADTVNWEKEPNAHQPTTQEQTTQPDKMPSVKSWNPLEHGFEQVAPHVFQVKGKTKPLSAQKTDGNKLEVWMVPPQGKNSVPIVNVTIDGLGQFPGIPLLTYPDPTAGIISKSAIKKADEAREIKNGDDELWQALIKNS